MLGVREEDEDCDDDLLGKREEEDCEEYDAGLLGTWEKCDDGVVEECSTAGLYWYIDDSLVVTFVDFELSFINK